MHLRSGLKLSSNLAGIREQLSINEGSRPAPADSGVYYHPGSYVPLPGWRSLDAREARLLLTAAPTKEVAKNIYVGDIPASLQAALGALGLQEVTSLEQVPEKVKEQEVLVKELSRQLDDFLRPFSSVKKYRFHRITRALPNRETVTNHWIRDKSVYIGLHIDQSRLFTPHTAYKSGNRISINLSKETRHLAFVNLSLIQVYKMIKERAAPAGTVINADTIAQLFFTYFPGYPVIRLAVRPYQYYIAPTDNFFHDATTLGNRRIDVTIVYTGVFDTIH